MPFTYTQVSTPRTPPSMVRNEGGGYSFPVDRWTKLTRFLIMGTEAGDYYATKERRTVQSTTNLEECIRLDGLRVVREIVDISTKGRALKNDHAILALALCASKGSPEVQKAAFDALPLVARIGTHLFQFVEYVQATRGWGPALRRAVGNWYTEKTADRVAFQGVKYQQREGWSNKDLLRLSHPKPPTDTHRDVFHWMAKGWPSIGEEPHPDPALEIIWAHERVSKATSIDEVTALIRQHGLTREMVPSQWHDKPEFWEALLPRIPATALIRNLSSITRVCAGAPWQATEKLIVERLHDTEWLRKSRVHPVSLLSTSKIYQVGRSSRGDSVWVPSAKILDALADAFVASFGYLPKIDESVVIGVDVSGSMRGTNVQGIPGLSAYQAASVMALTYATMAENYQVIAFDNHAYPLAISPRQRPDDVLRMVQSVGGGGTDCAQPIIWARERPFKADAFVILTDSQTWSGSERPISAIEGYRKVHRLPSKLITVAMCSNDFSLHGDDALSLNVCGFDTNAPALVSGFITGSNVQDEED